MLQAQEGEAVMPKKLPLTNGPGRSIPLSQAWREMNPAEQRSFRHAWPWLADAIERHVQRERMRCVA